MSTTTEATIEPGTDLVVVETLSALTVFAPGGVEDVLTRLEAQARAEPTDISTFAGRKAVASLAYKVARSKTALDKLGKDLTDEWRTRTNAVNEERRTIRDRLDALADEVRKPLTEWEQKDRDRIAAHEAALIAISDDSHLLHDPSSDDLKMRLLHLRSYPQRDWEEFAQRAAQTLSLEIVDTEERIAAAERREAALAEAARLAAEEAEAARVEAARLQAEREARIAADAAAAAHAAAEAEAAQRAAEAAQAAAETLLATERAAAAEVARVEREAREAAEYAARERARIEEREAQAVAAARAAENRQREVEAKARADAAAIAERVERDRLAAVAQAETDRQNAIEAERRRVATEQATAAREAEKRARNIAHQKRINGEILVAINGILKGFDVFNTNDDVGKAIITAIARGDVPHVKIEY